MTAIQLGRLVSRAIQRSDEYRTYLRACEAEAAMYEATGIWTINCYEVHEDLAERYSIIFAKRLGMKASDVLRAYDAYTHSYCLGGRDAT